MSHSWEDQHAARNGGHMDGFVRHMGAGAVGYFVPDDLPYYRAVADEFTVCDHYFCSVLGPTNPNRYYSMTGTIDPAGTGGGPAIDNGTRPWRWETYPERLQRAGIRGGCTTTPTTTTTTASSSSPASKGCRKPIRCGRTPFGTARWPTSPPT